MCNKFSRVQIKINWPEIENNTDRENFLNLFISTKKNPVGFKNPVCCFPISTIRPAVNAKKYKTLPVNADTSFAFHTDSSLTTSIDAILPPEKKYCDQLFCS